MTNPSAEDASKEVLAQHVVPVIICGGSGTRLWPRSRPDRPKPFLQLVGDDTLFRQTLERCRRSGFAPPVIVTGEAHLSLVEEQSRDFAVREIIVEPIARHTAAAIGLAAERLDPETVMLVCPSDHKIDDQPAFAIAAIEAATRAAAGSLVCLVIPATSPDPRYGYVCAGRPIGQHSFKIARFVEKPEPEEAERLMATCDAAWNAGIFAFRAGTFIAELAIHRPLIAAALGKAVTAGTSERDQFRPDADAFAEIQAEAVDKAVMENSRHAVMVAADMGWSDVGTWNAVHAARPKDAAGNTVIGDVSLSECRNLIVDSEGPAIRCIGLENMIVVADGDQILIMPLDYRDGA